MKKPIPALALAFSLLASVASSAFAQGGPSGGGPGPQPPPSPWLVSGAQISYGGCVLVPVGVAGGCKGNGTINATVLYQAGFAVLSTNLANGRILVGNGTGVATPVVPSGDVSMTNAGAFTVNTYAGGTTFGTAAHAALGTTGATVPQNSTANVFSAQQTINLNSGSVPTPITGAALVVSPANSTVGRVQVNGFGAITAFTGAVYAGTAASPTQVLSGTQLTGVNAYAYTGSALVGPLVSFRTYAAENITATAWGTKGCIATTPVTTAVLTDGLCQQNSGGITVGSPTGGDPGVGGINVAGPLKINNVAVLGAGITALTGDGTATGPGSATLTLTTVNSNVGSFGSSTAIPTFTVNGKGLITAASTAVVIAPAGTLTGATLAANVLASSLTSVGTLTGGATGAGFTVALTTSTVTGNLPIANAPSIAANTVIGSIAGGTAAALTATQLTTIPNAFTTLLKGLVPPPGSVTGSVLSDNGTWVSVGGTGTVTSITCAATLTCTASNPITGSGTIALNLSNANTWAAIQTFTNSDIKLLGSSTGATTFTSANSGASNFTLTFPAITSTLATTIASGAKALATSAIASGACTSAQTDTATGTLTTDAIIASFNGDPIAVTGYVPSTSGMLTIIPYPTADTVNFKVCNNTLASITPGAVTINWRVAR